MKISQQVQQLVADMRSSSIIVERMQLAHAAGDGELVLVLRDRLPEGVRCATLYNVRVTTKLQILSRARRKAA